MTRYFAKAKVSILFRRSTVDVGYTIILEKRRKSCVFLHEMQIPASILLFLNLYLLEKEDICLRKCKERFSIFLICAIISKVNS